MRIQRFPFSLSRRSGIPVRRFDEHDQSQAIEWINLREARCKQRPVAQEREVNVPAPELLALARNGPSPRRADLLAHLDQQSVVRSFRYGHIVGSF